MGIDITATRDGYNDRCKWYKKADVNRNITLSGDAVAQGVFYSTDVIPLKEVDMAEGNIKRKMLMITIETYDGIGDLEANDFVLYTDGYLWRVNSVIKDDKNESKEFSRRPTIKSTLELIR